MKQQLRYGIIINLSVLSLLLNIDSKVYGTEEQVESNPPATTIKQWQSRPRQSLFVGNQQDEVFAALGAYIQVTEDRAVSQLNNSPAIVTKIEVRSTTASGIEVVLNTANGETLQGIASTEKNNLIIDIPNARLQLSEPRFARQNPFEGISAVTATALSGNRVRVIISGVEGTPTGEIVSTTQGLNIAVIPPLPLADTDIPPDQVIDIIVTAQKQPERLQDVPISLTTFSRQEIEDAKIDSFRDVAANTPNFFTTLGDRTFNFQIIRGLGNAGFLTRDSISFFIDDVPYENVHQLLPGALFDLERVEVLRGPQGTLYGRNSQAGVINIISRPPTDSLEFTLGASYGDFNERQVQFSVSDAVIKDKLGFRLAGIYDARDGFTENTFLDEDANEQSTIAGRANLVWTPSDRWNISFNATVAANNDGDNTFVPIDQEDPFETELDVPGNSDLSINTQSLRIGYEGEGFKLTSITARNATNINYNLDADYSPEDLSELNVRQETSIISQEIRLQSPDDADRLRWLVGGYFQDRNFEIDPQQTNFSAVAGTVFFQRNAAGASIIQGRYDQTAFAVFGQIDFKPIDPLTLTAGLRYENSEEELERRSFRVFEGDNSAEDNTLFENSTVDDDILIPKFAIEYSFSPNLATYASITRGYKPPTQNYTTDNPTLREVRAEKSWNYEIGFKSSWFDDLLILNVAGFINDVSDLQVPLAGDTGFFEDITNAEASIRGFEIEVKAVPVTGLDLIAGFGYTDAEYTEYFNPFTGEDFDGNQLIYAPEFTYNLAAQYRAEFGLFSRVELQGLGNYFFNDDNSLKQDSLALVNARIGYEADKYGIYFYVNNLFDKEYLTAAFFSSTAGSTLASYGDRRTFGIQVKSGF